MNKQEVLDKAKTIIAERELKDICKKASICTECGGKVIVYGYEDLPDGCICERHGLRCVGCGNTTQLAILMPEPINFFQQAKNFILGGN